MGCHIIEISNAKFVWNIADKTTPLLLFCELDLLVLFQGEVIQTF